MKGSRRQVLFICGHNRCRSQMAEAYARFLAADAIEPASAGLTPAESVDPRVVRVMEEVGIPMRHFVPKPFRPEQVQRGTIVVTLCREAEENCPLPPEHTSRLFWPLDDPSALEGDDPKVMAKFRTVREDIRRKVLDLAEWIKAGLIT